MRTSTLVLLSAATTAFAHGNHARRAGEGVAAQGAVPESTAAAAASSTARDTETEEAAIKDPNVEITYYSNPVVAAVLPTYPEIWETANLSGSGILQGDKDLWAKVNASISPALLAIPPRGTREGDFTSVTYDGVKDEDCWWSYKMCDTPDASTGLVPDITRCQEPSTWGYTLDDGPNATHNAFYDYLMSIDQKATLFYIGSNVIDWPLEAQRGLADGHELCAHTWSHPYMTAMTNEEAFAELYFSKKAIKEIAGVTVRCWRPPYGDVDNRIRAIAAALDMITIVWDEDTDDWEWTTIGVPAVEKNYETIIGGFAQGNYSTHGTIVLSHELNNETMALSEKYLPTIRSTFTGGVMPVGVCMNNSRPYVEQDGYVYPTYEQYTSGTHSISLASPTAVTSAVIQLAVSTSVTASSSASTASGSSVSAAANRAAGSSSSNAAKATSSSKKASSASSAQGGGGSRGSAVVAWTAMLGAAGVAALGLVMA